VFPLERVGEELLPGDALRGAGVWRRLGLAAAFLGLGACLLLAASGIRGADGTRIETVELFEGRGRLYLPSGAAGAAVLLPAHEEGDELVSAGGNVSAALVLARGLDGAHALATELSRRGVAALTVDEKTDGAAAWDWLWEQSFVRRGFVALLAGNDRGEEALALAESVSGTPRACAAVVLCGRDSLVEAAADSPAGNLLLLTGQEGESEALTAFYGSAEDARRGFTGYFGERTARAAVALGGDEPSFFRPKALSVTADWLGSALGHSVEIADDDLICAPILYCKAGAACCLLLAAGTLLCGRRKKET